jgi:hypothetical protein
MLSISLSRIARLLALASSALVATSLSACAGGVTGTVDGDNVPAFASACFVEAEGSTFEARIIAFSFPNGCDALRAVREQETPSWGINVDTEGTDFDRIWKEHMPERFWQASLLITRDRYSDIKDQQALGLLSEDGDSPPAQLALCRQDGYVQEERGARHNRTCFEATSGFVRVTKFEKSQRIELDADARVEVIDSSKPADDITLKLTAGHDTALEASGF